MFYVANTYHRDSVLVLGKALIDPKKLPIKSLSWYSALASLHRWLILFSHLEYFLPVPNWVYTNGVLCLQISISKVVPRGFCWSSSL